MSMSSVKLLERVLAVNVEGSEVHVSVINETESHT